MGNFRQGGNGGGRGGFSRGGSFGNRSGGNRSGGRSGGFSGNGNRGGGFGNRGRDSGRRAEMHDVICDKCKRECQVPFKPTGDKPVFCSDCFRKDGDSRNSFENRRESSVGTNGNSEQFARIEAKLDKIIKVLQELEMDVDDEDSDEDSDEVDDSDEE